MGDNFVSFFLIFSLLALSNPIPHGQLIQFCINLGKDKLHFNNIYNQLDLLTQCFCGVHLDKFFIDITSANFVRLLDKNADNLNEK